MDEFPTDLMMFASPRTGEFLKRMVYGKQKKDSESDSDSSDEEPPVPAKTENAKPNTDVLTTMTFKQNTALMHEVMRQLLEQYNTITLKEAEEQLKEFTRLASTRIIEDQKGIPSKSSKSMINCMARVNDTVKLVERYRAGIIRYSPDKEMISPEEAKKQLHRYATAANLQWNRENLTKTTDSQNRDNLTTFSKTHPQQTTVMDILIVEETALMLARKLRTFKEQPSAPTVPSFEDLYSLIEEPVSKVNVDELSRQTTGKTSTDSKSSEKNEKDNRNLSPHDVLDKLSNFASLITKKTFEPDKKTKTSKTTEKEVSSIVPPDVLKNYEKKFNILINSSLRITGDKHK
jgi:hypothetical protein